MKGIDFWTFLNLLQACHMHSKLIYNCWQQCNQDPCALLHLGIICKSEPGTGFILNERCNFVVMIIAEISIEHDKTVELNICNERSVTI